MSRTIDEKIVSMQFDNRRFESNVKTSLSTLDKLKQSLKLDGASKGLENVSSAVKGFDVSPLSNGIETVKLKFSALEVMGITALTNITNSAVNAGKQLVKSLSVDQITAGWQKFGSKTTSVATLVAQGNDIETVNKELDRLNWFTDETSYNFTDMVANIAKFTASGKGLEDSVTAMEGIANWAALSGQNAQTASHAMYQLSQAMGAGVMRKEDYKSIQNASMDTAEFRQKCLDAGVALGTLKKNADGTYKSLKGGKEAFEQSQFAEHLTEDAWFTSDVMMKVFTDYSNAVNKIYEVTEDKGMLASEVIDQIHKTSEKEGISIDEAIKKLGYVDEAGNALFDSFGLKAFEAAQKARTWGDAVDSVKDAVSTGWMNTFEIIFGNAEEATELWTDLANAMYDVFASGAEARNELLEGWKILGGRDALIESFWNAWEAIGSIIKPIKEAFREIFPETTAVRLYNLTKKLKEFTSRLKISDETAEKLKRTFKGIFSVFDIFKKVLGTVGKAIANLLGSEGVSSLGSFLLDITASIGDFFTSLNEGFSTDGVSGLLSKAISGISDLLKGAVKGLGGFGDVFSSIGNTISNVVGKIWNALKSVFGFVTDNFSIGKVFGSLGGIFAYFSGKKLFDVAKGIKEFFDSIFNKDGKTKISFLDEVKEKFTGLLDSVHDSLQSFVSGVKVSSLLGIAAAIGILAKSMDTISKLSVPDITKSIAAIGAMLKMLSQTLKSMTKILNGSKAKGIVKSAVAMVIMAKAVDVLAKAMTKMAGLSWEEIAKGLTGVGGGLAELVAGVKYLDGVKVSFRTSISMLALAKACEMLGDAVEKFGSMKWDEIGRGLSGMGGALTELVAALGALSKIGGGGSLLGSLGIFVTVQSLSKMADGLKKFGDMAWDEIGRGLAAMGGALTEVAGVSGALGKIAGFSGILGSGSILIAVQSLADLADAFKKFGDMAWDEIGRGLVGMGGALTEVGTVTGALGYLTNFAGLLGGGSLLLAVQGLGDLADAFKKFGEMSWDEIGRGLSGMGGALTEVGTVTGALGYLTNFSGLLGGGSLLLAIQGLDDLANAFQKFGGMTWDEVKQGLVGMGGALTEVGTVTGALGYLTNFAGLLGGGSLLLAVQGLGDLADAFKKFGEMSWDEIGRGLAAMGSALSEVAIGGLLNTLSGFGAAAIAEIAAPLGTLADSVQKWAGVTVPEGLGTQLSTLSAGISSFTLAGWGADAIATVASGLGVMADSVRKWAGVTVPEEIGTQMSDLATGVEAFTLAGWGADAIATVAPGLGQLAISLMRWSKVKIPENIGDKLADIAKGVKEFSFAFVGGWSISSILGPLGDLADTIKKWNDVKIPKGLKDGLSDIASGVKSFSLSFVGGWSLSAVTGPLGDLAVSVKKWNDVNVPKGLGTQLSTLATGVKSFAGIGDISLAAAGIGSIASSVSRLSIVNFSAISTGFTSIAQSLTNLSLIGPTLAVASQQISSVVSSMMISLATTINASAPMVSNAFSSVITNALKSVLINQQAFYMAGISAVRGFANGINVGSGSVSVSVSAFVSRIAMSITSFQGLFQSAGYSLMLQFYAGVNSGMINAQVSVSVAIARIVASLNASQNIFHSAGYLLMTQFNTAIVAGSNTVVASINAFINRVASFLISRAQLFHRAGLMFMERLKIGIRFGGVGVSSAVRAVVQNVSSAISSEYQSFYSAGVYLGEGLVDGIKSKEQDAYNAGYALGQAAVQGEKDGQQSNSPSKLTIKAGKWMGEGLVIGMNRMNNSVYKTGKKMGNSAVDSISSALEQLSDPVKNNLDVQPKIRPVVDLSNTKSTTIDFGTAIDLHMIKPISSLSQIITDAQSKIDSSNREVVNAINSLREDLAEFYSSDGQEIGLYVDSKKLASSIAKPMNRELNILSKRGAY